MSLRIKLHNLIKERGKVPYGDICQFIASHGYKISYGERELRHLAENGKIENENKLSERGTKYISGYKIKEDKLEEPRFTRDTQGRLMRI